MSKVLVLNYKEVESIITPSLAMSAVERAYVQSEDGSGSNWPMVFHDFETGKADLDIKSGDLADTYGLKVVSWMAANSEKGLPELMSTVLLFDKTNGQPIALMNAGALTGCRTGAAAAVGAKYLARKDSETLLMVGSGHIGAYAVAAALTQLSGIKKVLVVNPHHPEKTAEQLPAFVQHVKEIMSLDGKTLEKEILACDSVEAGSEQADIIFTATPARSPIVMKDHVKAGTHFSCLGADMSGKEEIDPEIFRTAFVVGDDQSQCLSVGESEIPYKKGMITGLDATIGEVINGKASRENADQITIFDSTGIALQDLSTAALVIEAAKEKGLGVYVEL